MGTHLADREISQDGGTSKLQRKAPAARLRREKQRKNSTDHQYHLLGHHSLRCLEGGWALRPRLWRRSVPGRELGFAVWRQTEGLGNIVPQAGEGSATAEGNWEGVWDCRRSKATLLGRTKGGRAIVLSLATIGLSFSVHVWTIGGQGYRHQGASCGWWCFL